MSSLLLTAVTLHRVATSLESGGPGLQLLGDTGSVCQSGLPEEQGVHMQSGLCLKDWLRGGGGQGVLSSEWSAGCRPEQSRCCRSSAKVTGCRIPPHSRRPGLQLIGRGPPTMAGQSASLLAQWTRETKDYGFLSASGRSVFTHQTAHRLVLRVLLSGDSQLGTICALTLTSGQPAHTPAAWKLLREASHALLTPRILDGTAV